MILIQQQDIRERISKMNSNVKVITTGFNLDEGRARVVELWW